LAVANVQEQLAQGKTLDPNAPKLDHVNQLELLLQPVEQGYTNLYRGATTTGLWSAQRGRDQQAGRISAFNVRALLSLTLGLWTIKPFSASAERLAKIYCRIALFPQTTC
jgi:hypothetical protein